MINKFPKNYLELKTLLEDTNLKFFKPFQLFLGLIYVILTYLYIIDLNFMGVEIFIFGKKIKNISLIGFLPVLYFLITFISNNLVVKNIYLLFLKFFLKPVNIIVLYLNSILIRAFISFIQKKDILFTSKYIVVKRNLNKDYFHNLVIEAKEQIILALEIKNNKLESIYSIPKEVIDSWYLEISTKNNKFLLLDEFLNSKITLYHYYQTHGVISRSFNFLFSNPSVFTFIATTFIPITIGFSIMCFKKGFWEAIAACKAYIPFLGPSLDTQLAANRVEALEKIKANSDALININSTIRVLFNLIGSQNNQMRNNNLAFTENMNLQQAQIEGMIYILHILSNTTAALSYIGSGLVSNPDIIAQLLNILNVTIQGLQNQELGIAGIPRSQENIALLLQNVDNLRDDYLRANALNGQNLDNARNLFPGGQ